MQIRGLFLFDCQGSLGPQKKTEVHVFLIPNVMQDNIHIGKLIVEKLKAKERSVAWLARHINCDDGNLGRLLKNNQHIHSEMLLRISIALEEDFFVYYSEIIQSKKDKNP